MARIYDSESNEQEPKENQSLRQDIAVLNACMEDLVLAQEPESVVKCIDTYLRPRLGFEQVLVVRLSANKQLEVCASSHPCLSATAWPLGEIFRRVLTGESVILDDACQQMEWRMQSKEVQGVCGSALMTDLKWSQGKGIIAFFSVATGAFKDAHADQLGLFKPLLNQAFSNLESRQALQALVDQRTRELANSEKRFKSFAQSASDWFWETDTEHRYTYISASENQVKQKLYGHFIGQSSLSLRSEAEKAQHRKWSHYMHLINHRQTFHNFEYEAINGRGEHFWVSISGEPILGDHHEFLGYRGSGKDISLHKRKEQELYRAREVAEQANRAKSAFLANMSHEIRTPMNVILGLLEVIADAGVSTEQAAHITQIRHSANLLQALISDILDFSSIEAGGLRLEVDTLVLSELLHGISEQFGLLARKKSLQFEYCCEGDLPAHVQGDGTRLSQILFNLVGNAIKFTEEGKISLWVKYQEGELRFSVKDTGIGIEPGRIETLFAPFTQADASTKRKFGGTGLGLSIAFELVKAMGGRISCQSALGEGSQFDVSVPMPILLIPQGADDKAQAIPEVKGARVLVAEDSKANQNVIRLLLERQGHTVSLADNGKQALEMATAHPEHIDLILMDMRMPEMDGLEATKAIKSAPQASHIPIVALTANATQADQQACRQAGMCDFIAKPLSKDKVNRALSRWLAHLG